MSLTIEQLHETLQESFGVDTISKETVATIKNLVEEYTHEKTIELEAQLIEKNREIALIKEKAEEYANMKVAEKDAEIASIKEKAEEYGQYLIEKGNDYGKYLSEKAEEYGDYRAEMIAEKFNEYSQSIVEQFIEENKDRFVEHAEYNKMKAVFENVKLAFEANLFPLVEDHVVKSLEKRLEESNKQYNRLFKETRVLRQYADYVERQTILESACVDLSDMQKERVEQMTNSIIDLESLKESATSLAKEYKTGLRIIATPDKPEDSSTKSTDLYESYAKVLGAAPAFFSTKAETKGVDSYADYINNL